MFSPLQYPLLRKFGRLQADDYVHYSDAVYSVENAEQEIKMFVNSPDAQLITVKDGQHFLSASHPKQVDEALISFVKKWHKQ